MEKKTDDVERRANRVFIGMAQLRKRWGNCSHMFIERKLKNDPTFPKPYHPGRRRLFALDEIEAYEQASITRKEGSK
jgi:hypothetical protein